MPVPFPTKRRNWLTLPSKKPGYNRGNWDMAAWWNSWWWNLPTRLHTISSRPPFPEKRRGRYPISYLSACCSRPLPSEIKHQIKVLKLLKNSRFRVAFHRSWRKRSPALNFPYFTEVWTITRRLADSQRIANLQRGPACRFENFRPVSLTILGCYNS